MVPIILSVLFPGLGQFYLGKNWRGLIMLVLGVTPLYPLALIWSIVDVVRLNRRGCLPVFNRTEAVWALILFLVVIPVCFFLLGFVSVHIARGISEYTQPRFTRQEGLAIADAIERYRNDKGALPATMNNLIGLRPLRSSWRTDEWGNDYAYIVHSNGTYTLMSPGADGNSGTADDIIIRQ